MEEPMAPNSNLTCSKNSADASLEEFPCLHHLMRAAHESPIHASKQLEISPEKGESTRRHGPVEDRLGTVR